MSESEVKWVIRRREEYKDSEWASALMLEKEIQCAMCIAQNNNSTSSTLPTFGSIKVAAWLVISSQEERSGAATADAAAPLEGDDGMAWAASLVMVVYVVIL